MKRSFDSPIVLLGARLLSPYIMLFGLYVIFHGHYSPGGGFQGGALLAASVLLMRVASGSKTSTLLLRQSITAPWGVIGVLIYFGTGVTAMLSGGYFLDYGSLPIPGMSPEWLRYTGILIIEVGVGIAVMMVLVMIYDQMSEGEMFESGEASATGQALEAKASATGSTAATRQAPTKNRAPKSKEDAQ